MRKPYLIISLLGLGIVIYLLVLLIFLPAQLLVDRINQLGAASQSVKIQLVSGTVWSGYAKSVVTPVGHFTHLQWQISPWSLLRGDVNADIELGEKTTASLYLTTQLHHSLWNGSIALRTLHLQTNGEWLSLALQIPLALAGNIDVYADNIYFQTAATQPQSPSTRQSQLDCKGRLVWQNAGLEYPEPQIFGDYQIHFNSDQPNYCFFTLTSSSNSALPAGGNLRIKHNGEYAAQLWIHTHSTTPISLQRWLQWLGPADIQGKRQWRRQGRLADAQYLLNGT
jgi:general secretion pathway protein N